MVFIKPTNLKDELHFIFNLSSLNQMKQSTLIYHGQLLLYQLVWVDTPFDYFFLEVNQIQCHVNLMM